MIRFVGVFALGAVVGVGTLSMPIAARAADPVLVPILTPLTGAIADLGQDSKKSVAVALEQINADGGIGGRPLAVELVDTQGRPDVARRETERVMKTKRAPVVLGCDGSAGTSVAAQVAEQSNTVFMNSGAVSTEFFERGYKWYFSDQVTGIDEATAAIGLVASLTQAAPARTVLGILYEDSPRGTGTTGHLRSIAASTGLTVGPVLSYNRAERNMLPLITKLRETGATIVIWTSYLEDLVAGLNAMRDLDYFPYVIGIGNGAGHVRLPTLVSPDLVDKVKLAVVDYFNSDLKRAQPFVEAYRAKYDLMPSGYASLCYRGLQTLTAALRLAVQDGGVLDAQTVRSALLRLDIPGDKTIAPYEYIRFDEKGRNSGTRSIVEQWRDGASKKVTIWPVDVATSQPTPLK